jgi:HEAT repeat protein
MNQYDEIDKALETISSARDRWDYEEKQGPLWEAANKYPKEMIEYYYKYPEHQLSIAWCLANIKSNDIKNLFIEEAKNKSQYIRWYAIVNLRKYKDRELIEIYVKGLKDRSSLVKGESLKAIKNIKDERIKKALEHLLSLKSFKENSPGYYDEAAKILQSY